MNRGWLPLLAAPAIGLAGCISIPPDAADGADPCKATYGTCAAGAVTQDEWKCGSSTYLLQCQPEAEGAHPPYSCSCSKNGAQTGSTKVASLSCDSSDMAAANAGCDWTIE